ncbi:MAG: DUF5668 domain-containing protein [Vicinamibacterales bacterium]
MAEMNMSATFGDQGDDPRPVGAMVVGALLVAVGGALLAERTNLLPDNWRLSIWPVLLIAFGVARLAFPSRRGRRGLFYVLAGSWWLAGLQGWLSFERTWPLLIVFYGASVVVQGATTQPGLPRDRSSRRHRGGMSWVLTAILIGALISSPHGVRNWSMGSFDANSERMVAIAAQSEHRVETSTFSGAEAFTLMGRNVIDLRGLPETAPNEITLDGLTAMGRTTIRVPRGWSVDMKMVALMGRMRDTHREGTGPADWDAPASTDQAGAAVTPDQPRRLVVRGLVMMGEVAVTQ